MSNYQRVDIEQPLKPDGYCFVDEDGMEFAVTCDTRDSAVSVLINDKWQFDVYTEDIPKMIKVLQAVQNNLESK